MRGPYHLTIECSKKEYFAEKKEEENKILGEKAASYYENEGVWEKEKGLRQLQEREEAEKEEEVKRASRYMIGVSTETLKLHFKQGDLPGLSKLVIEERKKRAMAMHVMVVSTAGPSSCKGMGAFAVSVQWIEIDTNPNKKPCFSLNPQ